MELLLYSTYNQSIIHMNCFSFDNDSSESLFHCILQSTICPVHSINRHILHFYWWLVSWKKRETSSLLLRELRRCVFVWFYRSFSCHSVTLLQMTRFFASVSFSKPFGKYHVCILYTEKYLCIAYPQFVSHPKRQDVKRSDTRCARVRNTRLRLTTNQIVCVGFNSEIELTTFSTLKLVARFCSAFVVRLIRVIWGFSESCFIFVI